MGGSGLLDLGVSILIILILAYLLIWAIRYFVPPFAEPGRMIVGGIALIMIILKIAPFLGF